jgi:hypothetical protein
MEVYDYMYLYEVMEIAVKVQHRYFENAIKYLKH